MCTYELQEIPGKQEPSKSRKALHCLEMPWPWYGIENQRKARVLIQEVYWRTAYCGYLKEC